MDFFSDNAAGVHPAVLAAIADAAPAHPKGYDGDDWSARLDAAFSARFEAPVRVFAVPSGTAANALSLATLVPPWGGIYAHANAHVEVDEAGAVPFFTHGATHILVDGADGKLTVDGLEAAAARRRGDVHQVQAAALTITNATESGTVYTVDEVAALCGWAKGRALRVHMDGARLANAVAHLSCSLADITWRAGVSILSLGCIKNGGMSAEAIVCFDPGLAETLPVRRKRAGMMPSKGRFAAAQLLGLLESGAWEDNARAANAGAKRLAAAAGSRLLHPVEANSLFLRLSEAERSALRAEGFGFYDWEVDGPDAVRIVVRWDQSAAALSRLAERLAAFS